MKNIKSNIKWFIVIVILAIVFGILLLGRVDKNMKQKGTDKEETITESGNEIEDKLETETEDVAGNETEKEPEDKGMLPEVDLNSGKVESSDITKDSVPDQKTDNATEKDQEKDDEIIHFPKIPF